jgi:hypothetical protein
MVQSIEKLRASVKRKTTEELTEIYRDNDKDRWVGDPFPIIEKVLKDRGAPVPEQIICPSLFICTTCGHLGRRKMSVRGHDGIVVILLLFFIIPGIIYAIWRSTTKTKVCIECGKDTTVSVTSPVGEKLIQDLGL